MKRSGQQQMDFAVELEAMKQKDKTLEEYSREFIKDKKIRTSSIIWFSIIISAVIIVLAFASNTYLLLLTLPLVPLAPLLVNFLMGKKQKKEQEFMKQHFMKQGDPKYWGRGNGKEEDKNARN